MGMLPLCELSYDLLPNEDGSFDFLEGYYRKEGKGWGVMIFSHDNVPRWRYRKTTWPSGSAGYVFTIPREQRIDVALVERCLSRVLGPHEWVTVKGPDSMALR